MCLYAAKVDDQRDAKRNENPIGAYHPGSGNIVNRYNNVMETLRSFQEEREREREKNCASLIFDPLPFNFVNFDVSWLDLWAAVYGMSSRGRYL